MTRRPAAESCAIASGLAVVSVIVCTAPLLGVAARLGRSSLPRAVPKPVIRREALAVAGAYASGGLSAIGRSLGTRVRAASITRSRS
ncbi:hypothetical protein Cs7R123_05100 [Catellatospora sp. TT07R-123]|nr:hypothetical protein Cs7R123_05100 [Catellatospora sp. TT07R-123]